MMKVRFRAHFHFELYLALGDGHENMAHAASR
jgi:hypothetical protein